MLRAKCQCKATIYIDTTTGHKFNSQSLDDPHTCQSEPISLYVREFTYHKQFVKLDFYVPESEYVIAAKIVAEALKLGKDPYRVQTERRGDKLYIKTA